MPTYTPTQKSAIQQFTGFTHTKESVAAKQLKSHNWNIEQAVDAYFQSNNPSKDASSSTSALSRLFDSYRDNPKDEPDTIGVEGSMRYLQDLGLSLEEPVVLAILTELAAPTMGELTRSGFVDGWKRLRAATLSDQKSTLPNLRTSLSSSSSSSQGLFRQTYKHTFRLALAPGQRSLPLDTALEYWRLLLSPPALKWNTKTTPWLDYWIEYLTTKWKKGVSKDVWEQTAVFAGKSLEDETMGWWSEDGAWPGCLDEFVGFVRAKRGDGGAEEQGMES
ncbi:MAG: hypothetical protein L6R36_002675 [Xanthoria steineri]|nr:MAG: hypothetical protein L6R36_002675 [Xanthoria steineri]